MLVKKRPKDGPGGSKHKSAAKTHVCLCSLQLRWFYCHAAVSFGGDTKRFDLVALTFDRAHYYFTSSPRFPFSNPPRRFEAGPAKQPPHHPPPP